MQISDLDINYLTTGVPNHPMSKKMFLCAHQNNVNDAVTFISKCVLPLSTQLVLYYNRSEPRRSEDILHLYENWLSDTKVMILYVTREFIEEDNFGRTFALNYALEHEMPILPLIMESGLESAFNDLCGGLQAIMPFENTNHEVSFGNKINIFFNKLFNPFSIFNEFKKVFDTCFFLSYRKKDRMYVKDLLNGIHKMPKMQRVAIWYDEFLRTGTNFEEDIMKMMEQCSVVILMVTPSILEPHNYVKTVEYKVAMKLNKPVIPICVKNTDFSTVNSEFTGINNIYSWSDRQSIYERIKELLLEQRIVLNTSLSPERTFLLGQSYISGNTLEEDHIKGIELVEAAAQSGYDDATEYLVKIYSQGIHPDVSIDYDKAIDLQQKYADKKCDLITSPKDSVAIGLWHAEVFILSDLFRKKGDLENAEQALSLLYDDLKFYYYETEYFDYKMRLNSVSFKKAQINFELGSYETCISNVEEILDDYLEQNRMEWKAGNIGNNTNTLFLSFVLIINSLICLDDYSEAKDYCNKMIEERFYLQECVPSSHITDEVYKDYRMMGSILVKLKEYKDAHVYLNGALESAAIVASKLNQFGDLNSEIYIDYIDICYSIAELYRIEGDNTTADKYYQDVLIKTEAIATTNFDNARSRERLMLLRNDALRRK